MEKGHTDNCDYFKKCNRKVASTISKILHWTKELPLRVVGFLVSIAFVIVGIVFVGILSLWFFCSRYFCGLCVCAKKSFFGRIKNQNI